MNDINLKVKDCLKSGKFTAFYTIFLIFLILTVPYTAFSQDLNTIGLLGGLISSHEDRETSYAWQISYMEDIGDHFGWSLSWLNEGHMPNHHRDGPTIQLWARKFILNRRLLLAAGAGPYLAFDTQNQPDGNFRDARNGGGVFSLAAFWNSGSQWFLQARVNTVLVNRNFDTTALLFGVGYRLDPDTSKGDQANRSTKTLSKSNNEITGFLGDAIVHGPDENSFAFGIEYRRSIARHLEWTVGYIDEGDNTYIDRKGITAQLWPKQSFFDDRLTLGAGVGVYSAVDNRRNPGADIWDDAVLIGLITLTGSYHLSHGYLIRISFCRTITDYDRDTDILFAGLGYRF